MKPGGVVVWVVGDSVVNGSETGTSFKQALYFKKIGFRLHDTMIYAKDNPTPCDETTTKRYTQSFEYIFILTKGKVKTFNPILLKCQSAGKPAQRFEKKFNRVGGIKNAQNRGSKVKIRKVKETKFHTNIFYYVVGQTRTNHPAPFPIRLVKDQMKTWTDKGDLVYDPFMGSGTVARVAIQGGRHYIGSEISEEYCKEAIERIEKTPKGFFQEL